MKNLIPNFIIEKFKNNIYNGQINANTLFMDISGFTPMTERLMQEGKEGAEVLSGILNSIFEPIIKSIYERKGFISTFAGDAFTSIFPDYDNPMAILHCADKLKQIFNSIGLQKTRFGDFKLSVKIGLSSGVVDWGIIGSDKYKTYYFKGEAIDGCAYSEHHCNKMDIILDSNIYSRIKKDIEVNNLDERWFLLDKINIIEEEIIESNNITKPNNEILSRFINQKVLEISSKGEFRNIVSVFISFEERKSYEELNSFIAEIINQTNTLGGYFNKIDFGDKGGVILIVFGAPVSYENDIKRAVELIQNLKKTFGMSIRAGVTNGIAYAGFVGSDRRSEYTALGDIVNQSARFMMKAEWGQIWLSDDIQKKTKRLYTYQDMGKCEFKGKSKPIQVYKLIDKTEYSDVTLFKGKMVGRNRELNKLKEWVNPVFNNKFAGITYIYGEAGIGKSRIAYELSHSIRNDAETFLMQCDNIIKKSLNPFVYFLKNYFNQTTAHTNTEQKENFELIFNLLVTRLNMVNDKRKDTLIKELKRTKSFIAALLDIHYEDSLYEKLEPKNRYENILYGLNNLFRVLSLFRPIIILIEDIQWLDPESHNVFAIMTRLIEDYPIMIIATSRFNDDGSKPIINVDEEVLSQEIIIDKLNDDSVKNFIELQLGNKINIDVVNFINKRAENNPFYIEQFCLYLKENNLFNLKNNEIALINKEIDIPSDINTIIISRIDRLSTELKDIIQVASVLGREVEIELLINIIELYYKKPYNRDLEDILKEIENEQLWSLVSEIKYIFKHALLREAVYEMQLRERLRNLHKLAGESMINVYHDTPNRYVDIAYQFEKAEFTERAIEYYEKAGEYLQKEYKNNETLEVYEKLINYYDNPVEKAKYLLKKAYILRFIGKWDDAVDILILGINNLKETNENVFNKEENQKLLSNIKIQLGWIHYTKGNPEQAVKSYDEAKKIAEKIQDISIIANIEGIMGGIYYDKGEVQEAIKRYDNKLDLCKKMNDKVGYANALANKGLLFFNKGDFDIAMDCFEEQKKMNLEFSNKDGYSNALEKIGYIYWSKGDYETALKYFQEAKDISFEIGDKRNYAYSLGYIGQLYWTKGEYDKAMEYYNESKQISLELGDKYGYCQVLLNIGNIYYEKGNFDNALKLYEEVKNISKKLEYIPIYATIIGNMGYINYQKGEYEKSLKYHQEHKKICEETEDNNNLSRALVNIGMVYHKLSDYEQAIKYYDLGIDIGKKLDIKYYLTFYIYNKAKLLYDMGQYDKAYELNNEALHIADIVNRKEQVFDSNIMKYKIEYINNKTYAIDKLKDMLSVYTDSIQQASLFYELWKLSKNKEYKEKSLLNYEDLYKKTPLYLYKKRIEEMEIK